MKKKMKLLHHEDMILAEDGSVKPMPARNKACPCNSKLRYKKCCMPKDEARKIEFMNKGNKKLDKDPLE